MLAHIHAIPLIVEPVLVASASAIEKCFAFPGHWVEEELNLML